MLRDGELRVARFASLSFFAGHFFLFVIWDFRESHGLFLVSRSGLTGLGLDGFPSNPDGFQYNPGGFPQYPDGLPLALDGFQHNPEGFGANPSGFPFNPDFTFCPAPFCNFFKHP